MFLWLVVWSSAPHAQQDAVIVGTIIDTSRAVLPGVTVTATGVDTGRQYVATTDERGEYRLPGIAPGTYKLQAELAGFATVVIPEVELLVGQNATVPFTLQVATLTENVTVTGEAPLLDTQRAQVSGNVDRRQMEALPIQGRNWLELSMMVKGVTANSIAERPGVNRDSAFQLNLDGQQITQNLCCSTSFGQPGLSREAVAEYQIVTNLFDVTMGRSAGLQVQAVSRAGTNDLNGSVYGFFRDDRFNSPDLVVGRVLPYSNQQTGFAVGGPVLRDRMHFFTSYEYEREPNTIVAAPSALNGQSLTMSTKTTTHNLLARVDRQFGANNHLMVRGTFFDRFNPVDQLSGTSHPSNGAQRGRDAQIITANWTRVLGGGLMQEVRGSFYRYHWLYSLLEDMPPTPEYRFPGLTIGGPWNYPEEFDVQIRPAVRYDLSWHKGSHDLKIGGEFVRGHDTGYWPARARGQFFFSSIPADIGRRFPIDAWNDPSRWDLTGLDSLVLRFDQYSLAPGGDWDILVPRPTYATWLGDVWSVNDRLTLNMGLRYDLSWGDLAPPGVTERDIIINNGKFTENVGFKNGMRDLNNIAPRVGFSYKASDTMVVRGGSGMFYGNTSSTQALEMQQFSLTRIRTNSYANDRLPGFLQNPTRGVVANTPQSPAVIAHDFVFPYTVQTMIGMQKQLSGVMAFDADLVHWRGYNEDTQRDPNLFYDPATGFNVHPSRGRPNPDFGPIILRESKGRSDYLALASSFTRRYANNFQAGLTYTLMFYKHDTAAGGSGYGATPNNPFNLDDEWARAGDFQRHTLRANGIFQLPYDISIAGSLFVGSGNYSNVTSGFDAYGSGGNRVRRDFSIIPRNSFKGDPLKKVDLRFSKDVRFPGGVRVSGIAEVFNVFNNANFGSYNTLETSTTFGAPRQSLNSAYLPRVWQLAFKVAF
jgi:hypothetical protein